MSRPRPLGFTRGGVEKVKSPLRHARNGSLVQAGPHPLALTGADRVHDRAGVPNAPFIPPSVSATADATGTGLPSTLLS